ncbi:hypothetical protein FRC02_004315 [Tulasnella sp. 418]|nr:hypothetical protein FRC02_004315 [Tulasnella sp. 418]
MDDKTMGQWSVFYLEDSWLKEMIIGNYKGVNGFDEVNWHSGRLNACGKHLNVDLRDKVRKPGRIQATIWLGTYKSYHALSAAQLNTNERPSDANSGTKVASAFQRYDDQTYQFVFYSGASNKLMLSQRAT